MKLNKGILLLAIGILLYSFSLSSCLVETKKSVKVSPIQQSTDKWCWAASLSMILETVKNFPVSDCEVVGMVNKVLFRPGNSDCCAHTGVIGKIDRACYRGGDIWDFLVAFTIFNIDYQFYTRPLEFDEIKDAIDKGHLIMSLRVFPWNGHASLISGYDEKGQMLEVMEPTLGKKIFVSYSSFRSSLEEGIWKETFVITNSKSTETLCRRTCTDKLCSDYVILCDDNNKSIETNTTDSSIDKK